ncbi:MAG: MBL fold metallo-hydrolase [Bacteroides sp.]|nr:MBL fold metallo-hydrolase [Prevotella sp.]MCM1407772.1 MBL fold metallo-hydrolase [Treponema brennaborense]MCM1468880.1 MBL fold metallo-hydrolase [Bacteroides sp.]
MKKIFVIPGAIILLALAACAATQAVDAAPKGDANKEVKSMLMYQGHGSAKLVTAEGKVVYIDPFAGEGYDDAADLILVTHEHPDHNKVDLMPHAADCVIFRSADAIKDGKYQTLDIYGLHIEAVQAYNKNHRAEECVGFLVTVNGKTLYFAGDTSKTEQMAQLSAKNIDYAFLPTDGRFNMDIAEAIECAELIKAKHTVPYHIFPGELFNRERAEQFVTESACIIEPGECIEI